jgi:hypothetical protein
MGLVFGPIKWPAWSATRIANWPTMPIRWTPPIDESASQCASKKVPEIL